MATRRSSPALLPHDAAYKAICSHAKVIEHALRGYLREPAGPLSGQTLNALDFSTMEKLPVEWVGEDFRSRRGDQAWRVRFRWAENWGDPSGYLIVTVEFQSRPHPDMALRVGTYSLDLSRELRRRRVVKPGGGHPAMLPLVLHNGDRPWRAAAELGDLTARPGRWSGMSGAKLPAADGRLTQDLAPFQMRQRHFVLDFFAHRDDDLVVGNLLSLLIALEQARSKEALAPLLRAMAAVPEEGLRRDLFRWMLLLATRHGIELPPIEELEKMASIDSFHSRLDERMGRWTQEWLAQGRSEGIAQGRTEGFERGRTEGIERGRTEGIERGRIEGIERGRIEGMAQQRALLARQATAKFGRAAEGFDSLLAEVRSSEALAEVGEWLLEADTAGQLAAKVRAGVSKPSV